MDIDGIIFDLDGTLWDSRQAVTESWNDSLARHAPGAAPFSAAQIESVMGLGRREIGEKLFSAFGSRGEELCGLCLREENGFLARRGGRLYPGTEALLKGLAESLPLFIVSNCQAGYIESFLSFSGLGPWIKDHLCEGDTGLDKAGNIGLIRRRHGLERPVYLGDTALDEKSAKAAGCLFVHAGYGFGRAQDPAGRISSPGELPGLLSKLQGGTVWIP